MELTTGRSSRRFEGHSGPVMAAAFSLDGRGSPQEVRTRAFGFGT